MSKVRDPATYYPFNKPFFRHGAVVKRNGVPLVEGTDFYFGHPYVIGTLRHAKLAYGSVWLYNKTSLNGITVEAEQLPYGEAKAEQLNAEKALGPIFTPERTWDDVVGDLYYPAIDVQYDEDNWCGELELMLKIDELNTLIKEKDPTDDDLYQIGKLWFDSLTHIYNRSPIHEHLTRKDNPHNEEYGWIGALALNGYATNTAKFQNMTLAQLTVYANGLSPNTTHLVDKLLKVGKKTVDGSVVFKNGVGYIRNKDSGIAINNRNGQMSAVGSISVKSETGRAIHFGNANASLILYPDARGLQFNGRRLLTEDIISDYINPPSAGNTKFCFGNYGQLSISGDGTKENPARFVWEATTNPENPKLNTINTVGTSAAVAAHISTLLTWDKKYDSFLYKGKAAINGVLLTESTTIDKNLFGLSNVLNYSDAHMPMSNLQLELLEGYSAKGHTHSPEEFGVSMATSETMGVVRFAIHDGTDPETLEIDPAKSDVATQHVINTVVSISDEVANGPEKLPKGAINITRYGRVNEYNETAVNITTVNGVHTLRFVKDTYLYANYKLYTIPPVDLDVSDISAANGGHLYVAWDTDSDSAWYFTSIVKIPETDNTLYVARIYYNGSLIVRPLVRVRMGKFVELEEHITSVQAHGVKQVNKDEAGLGALVNMPPSASMKKPTFEEVFNTWLRFSHKGANQPSSPSEMAAWMYNKEIDTVKQPLNADTFVGLVSPDKYSNYVFDTILSSTDPDDDRIGVIIGFHVDSNGREHTLSVLFNNDGGDIFINQLGAKPVEFIVTDNYMQTGTNSEDQIALLGSAWTLKEVAKGWRYLKDKRVRVERMGNTFIIDNFEYSSRTGDTNHIIETLAFNLENGQWHSITYVDGNIGTVTSGINPAIVSRGVKYLDASNFGYCTRSQPSSTYKNLVRPDEDSRNMYATLPTLLDSISFFSKQRAFIEKTRLVRSGVNHLALSPDGVGIEMYGGTLYVPWERYYFDEPIKAANLYGKCRVGVVHVDVRARQATSSLFDVQADADTYTRPYDVSTLPGL